jgi:DNA (cytosine-5)-methyltransferase 1
MRMMRIFCIDFMCGIGGATRGFLDAGVNVIKGIDIDEQCRETYEKNN